MTIAKRIVLMIQFLTTFPVPVRLELSAEDYGKSLAYAPLAGLLLGAVLAGFMYICRFCFSPLIAAAFVMILYILLTGGLHLDGWADTADGLFSNRRKEQILEIMKDSRIGVNGVLALISVFLLNTLLIAELAPRIICLMPVAGRMSLPVTAGLGNYGRKEGLARAFVDHCGRREIITGGLLSLLIAFAFLGGKGALALVFSAVFAVILAKWWAKKINGVTGDILGAVCELTQTFFMIWGYLFLR